MKKLIIIPILMGLMVVSCDQKEQIEPTECDPIPLQHRQHIYNLGFDPDDVTILQENYVVEGDIALPINFFESLDTMPQTRQNYYKDFTILPQFQKEITVFIGGGLGIWESAFKKAITEWNKALKDTKLSFKETTGSADIQIVNMPGNNETFLPWQCYQPGSQGILFRSTPIIKDSISKRLTLRTLTPLKIKD